MKSLQLLTRSGAIVGMALAAILCGYQPAVLGAESKPADGQETFASPDDAVKALREAVDSQDKSKLDHIFGPEIHHLRTGDPVEDANHRAAFATNMDAGCQQVQDGDNKVTLEIGSDKWPFPIPLVKNDSQWFFDTAAGREEIINRHVGSDELHAIGVCTAYVDAQRKFGEQSGESGYALKFKSSPGQKDGLYWKTSEGETPSPFSELVAQAHAEGYHHNAQGSETKPFEGYYFHILTCQGKAAPGGKMNYMHHGKLSKGFALVAYPARWDQSGVMSFIVNQDGKVYERNLGKDTVKIASSMKEYNPDSDWSEVKDEGVYER